MTEAPPRSWRAGSISRDPFGWMGLCSLVLLAIFAGVLVMAARQGLWMLGAHGGLAPTDFSEFWAAGRLAHAGQASRAYDWPAMRALLDQQTPGAFAHKSLPFYYPPFLLLLLAPIMAAPPLLAAVLWMGGAGLGYFAALRLVTPRPQLLLAAIAAPAVFLVVCVGQTGLLSAALLCGGLALTDRRPLLAGVLIGALAYKPQFGVLLPIALIAAGKWRVVFSAAATVIALVVISGLMLGWDVFAAFAQATRVAPGHIPALSAQSPAKLQSVYGLALTLGGSASLAWAAQGLAAAAAAMLVAGLWRSTASSALKAAGLAASVLLVSPYSAIYDLTLPTLAIVFLLSATPAPGRLTWIGLGLAYVAPLLFPFLAFPIAPLVCTLILCVVVGQWRAATIHTAPAP
ncbi:MAG: glycosyltransferase family 87 protein [Caulobacteraceae bacterium]